MVYFITLRAISRRQDGYQIIPIAVEGTLIYNGTFHGSRTLLTQTLARKDIESLTNIFRNVVTTHTRRKGRLI